MRKNLIATVVLVLMLTAVTGVQAADVGGEFTGELRVLTKEDKPLENAVASMGVKLDVDGDLGDAGSWKLVLDTSLDKALNKFRSDIWDADDTDAAEECITLELDEAYLNLYSVAGEALDLRLGKQYVDTGVGDGITTFNLTKPVAANFIDELQNTRAVTGIRADWYPGDFHVGAFLQPRLTPTKTGERIEAVYGKAQQAALLPVLHAMGQAQGIQMAEVVDKEASPTYKEDGMGFTLKASRLVGDYDLGVVYQRGYVPSSMVSGFEIEKEPIGFDPISQQPLMRLNLIKGYLPLQKIGVTAEGTMGDAGIWGELTYNIPKAGFFSEGMQSPALPREYQFTSEKYVTGLVGMDYFFDNGVYVNGQVIHGLPQEVTKSMLNTYLAADIYQDFLNNRLRLEGQVVYCFGDEGWMIMPEAVYQLSSNMKICGKLAIPGGDDESLFCQMEDLTQVLVGVSLNF